MQPADANQNFSLPKAEKLCSQIQIAQLISKKQSFVCYPFKCYYDWEESSEGVHQFVVSVPKRNFKHAVDRNRIKRLTREAYRLNKKEHLSHWTDEVQRRYHLLFLFIGKEMPTFQSVEEKMLEILQRLKNSSKR